MPTPFFRDGVRPSPSGWLIILAIAAFPVTFLGVRHGVHVSLYGLLLVWLGQQFTTRAVALRGPLSQPWLAAPFVALFAAVIVTQAANQRFDGQAFDGPSHLLVAGAVFLLLRDRGVAAIRVLERALPVGMLVLLGVLVAHPETSVRWGGRLASSFVDPNSMGSQTLVLGTLCLLSLRASGGETPALRALKLLGGAVALYISIFSASRGGWLAFPVLVLLWASLTLADGARQSRAEGRRRVLLLLICLAAVAAALIGLYLVSHTVHARISSAVEDIGAWVSGRNTDTPTGYRLSMWKISLQLALDRPLFGFGEHAMGTALAHHPLAIPANQGAIDVLVAAGPHSDLLSKLLTMGGVGVLAYGLTLGVPFVLCWRQRDAQDADRRLAARMGLYYLTGVAFVGLANEMLSLKYLCSFFGLMIAVLLAEVQRPVAFSPAARDTTAR